jgi:hypothetical protein
MSAIAALGAEVEEPYTPAWWLTRLYKQLVDQRPRLDYFDRYYRGDHPLAFASLKFESAFGALFRSFADNWTQIVVDAHEERLNVEGFRFGGEESADTAAWDIWQANDLDADSQIAHTEALIKGSAYVLVWPGDPYPEITIEDPSQMVVASAPGRRRQQVAALKVWSEDDGYEMATLYLPTEVYKFRSAAKAGSLVVGPRRGRWVPREVPGESWPIVNPFGVVPVLPLVNRRRLLGPGESEIANVIPVQDAVNKIIADAVVASEFASFRQRWATGLDIPKDPVTGQPVEPFRSAVDRLWVANPAKDRQGQPVGEVKLGEFEATDLSPYVELVAMFVQHIASQSRTPPHYFYLRGEFPSGESIRAAEAGLVSKARRSMRSFGEAWERVMRLAFLAQGDSARAGIVRCETIWRDPEVKSESELIDSLVKQQALGIPNEVLWEKAGYSPTEVERIKAIWMQLRSDPTMRIPPSTTPAPAA